MNGFREIRKNTIVIATRNFKKSKEIREFFKDHEVEFLDLNDLSYIPELKEDGSTFEENAYKKGFITAKTFNLPALADDSGLVVDALGGKPGILSARYAGDSATDKDNNEKLLREMYGEDERSARFVCVIAVVVPDGQCRIYRGECEGVIANAPSGKGGFGYDPIFYYPPLGKTFAELSTDEKGKVSHRGRALAKMKDEFDELLKWIRESLQERGDRRRFP